MGNRKRQQRRIRMNKRKIDSRVRRKLVALFGLVILAFVVFTIYLSCVSIVKGEEYERRVRTQNQQSRENVEIPFRRGDITDRNGTVLASSEKIYNVILDCKVVNTEKTVQGEKVKPYVEPTVEALTEIFSLNEDELMDKLTDEKTKNSPYQVVLKGISINEKKRFEEYQTEYQNQDTKDLSAEEKKEKEKRSNIKGVWFEDTYKRIYPMNSQACDLIGFTYNDGTADWGLEGYYADILDGVNGRRYSYYGASNTLSQEIIEPEDGKNITATIDMNIQKIIRSKLEDFNRQMAGNNGQQNAEESGQKKGAENVGVILMDPNNGEILGMDSTDWYDLNDPRDLTKFYSEEQIQAMIQFEKENEEKRSRGEETVEYDKERDLQTRLYALNTLWRNFCISDTFEPGSTAKPMNVAAAYDTGAITDEDTFVCDGFQRLGGFKIRCAVYPNAHGTETAGDALKNSCNDALMQIAEKMGSEDFLKYQKMFGFGVKTGIDLPGEAPGLLYPEDGWNEVALATSSFGQGYNVTMIQQIAAFSAVINGGYYYQPRVVSEITDSNGSVVEKIEPKLQKQVISAQVSEKIRGYLGTAVEEGTGKSAKVDGYSMGGKTGTAEKVPRKDGRYLVSFIGFAPLDDPQVAIYVVVDEPHTDAQANSVYAQELAKNILTEVLPYLGIYPDEKSEDPGEGSETGAQNDQIPAPAQQEEDETVRNGGNSRYSDGMTNEDMRTAGE